MSSVIPLDTSKKTCESTSKKAVLLRPMSEQVLDLVEDHCSRPVLVTSRLVVVEVPDLASVQQCLSILKTNKLPCFHRSFDGDHYISIVL